MRILFDYQAFEMQPIGGVSRSYAALIARLREEDDCVCKLGVKESNNVHLKEYGLAEGVKPLHYTHDKWFGGRKKFKGQRTLARKVMEACGHDNDCLDINQEYCVHLLKRQQFDIFEPTFYDPYFLPYLKNKPFVLTVHDMIPEILHVDEPQAILKKRLCPLAAHIHVPSQNTKDDLIRIMNIPAERVTVIPHGAPAVPPRRNPLFDFPYLLYVGTRWSYKNFNLYVDECAIAIAKQPDLHVVCTGQPFQKEEEKMLADYGLTDQFIHYYATEEGLQALYQNAVAFVYPSAYEGFGMPILEAFVCGCPVMLNNAGCFPEVGGDAAIYFDINRKGNLAEQILEFLNASTEMRENLISKGYARAKLFSWGKSAALLTEQYKDLV